MTIKSEEIVDILRKQLEGFEPQTQIEEMGHVISVGDGIAKVYGLSKAMSSELLEFPNKIMGMVMNLEKDTVGAVLFG
ncbi:MAG: F0F1 ATP synthase subunit alpha, partial [Elusimicrobiota bacterium]